MLLRRRSTADSQRGAVAIEFALVAPVIFLLLFGILELSLLVLSEIQLSEASRYAARQVRTGEIQTATDPADAFQDAVCEKLGTIVSCSDTLYRVKTFPTMSSGELPQKLGNVTQASLDNTGYRESGPKEVVFMQVFQDYDFTTPLIGELLSNTPNSGNADVSIVSTRVFRNEPFGDKLD